MKPQQTLGRVATPDGRELVLYVRDGVFSIRVDGLELMSSRAHGSEEALARLVLGGAQRQEPSVLVGGLGMGYTLRAVLDAVPGSAKVTVVEIFPAVVGWNRGELAHLAREPLEDADWDLLRRMYLGEIRVVDDVARVIVEAVDAVSDPGETLCFVLSDHGENLGDHGHLTHILNVYDSNLRIVLLARVAEQTGLNVVNGFPARDMALGGIGGPLDPLPAWILLRRAEEDRILLDLGRTFRITYLPRDRGPASAADVLSFDVGPGMSLLDLLTHRLTNGEQAFDVGGRLSVQGHRISELVDHWLSQEYFQNPLPRWEPRGVSPQPFLDDSLRMALEQGWSVRDLLCSATHFVADTMAQAFERLRAGQPPVGEILLTGGGQANGMLLREIASRLPQTNLRTLQQRGINNQTLDAASAAMLAALHLDQVPANLPAVTGADVGRVLGQLTPGSPRTWQLLLERLGARRPAVRPLRSAL